jgi:hypothetical protein
MAGRPGSPDARPPVADIEGDTLRAFAVGHRLDRWVEGLASPKRRAKTVAGLHDGRMWRPDVVTQLRMTGVRSDQLTGLVRRLTDLGAPTDCHVVCCDPVLDGRVMPVGTALEELSDEGCALLICLSARLALHLPEAPADPLLLQR